MTLRPAATAFIKSKGMKFGIYGAAGQTTCAGKAGGLYHEYLDAQTYADWGAEYLKGWMVGGVGVGAHFVQVGRAALKAQEQAEEAQQRQLGPHHPRERHRAGGRLP